MQFNNYGPIGQQFIAHFDTQNAGPKRVPDSYEKIKSKIKADHNITEITFYTDIIEEAHAAEYAGLNVVVLVRPGNKPIENKELEKITNISTFDELLGVSSGE